MLEKLLYCCRNLSKRKIRYVKLYFRKSVRIIKIYEKGSAVSYFVYVDTPRTMCNLRICNKMNDNAMIT